MPPRKRGQGKIAATKRVVQRQVREQLMCFCPVCGKTMGRSVTLKVKYMPLEYAPYLTTIEFDPNKPFGVALETLGRGLGKRVIRYLDPDDMPEDFELLKARLIQAKKEWVDKGWITPEEV